MSRSRSPMALNSAAEPTGLGGLVARCLTGEPALVGPAAQLVEPSEIAAALAEAGWSPERLLGVRDERQAAGLGWPMLMPADERGDWGLAQLHASSRLVIAELGLTSPARVRAGGEPLSPRDRALLADRPPHHGTVG